MNQLTMIFRQGKGIVRRPVNTGEEIVVGSLAVSYANEEVLIQESEKSDDRDSLQSESVQADRISVDALPYLYSHNGQTILLCEGPDNNGLLHFGPSLLTGSMTMIESLYWTAIYARSADPLLILGESGAGKEEVARFAHHLSGRKGPFVAVNLGGMPVELAESELFGHQKGAFTGATSNRQGLFELANGGTLFLDEVGDTPLSLQTKLLRVVEAGKFRILGTSKQVSTDCRVVAATNRDLKTMTETGLFRFDLYQRMSPLSAFLPPLRDRKPDIKGLVQELARRKGFYGLSIDEDALTVLLSYPWKGNVRELAAFVTRLVLIADHGKSSMWDVKLALSGDQASNAEPLVFRDSADLMIYDAFTRNKTGKSVYSAIGISKSAYYVRLKKIRHMITQ